MKTGAQLYTIKSYTQNVKDFACSMKKIAEMGYKTVQISAVGKDLKPEQIREICDANGARFSSFRRLMMFSFRRMRRCTLGFSMS